ncbi:MAG: hypothetical protein ABL993_13185 [Vicinamibacterales bacterium]
MDTSRERDESVERLLRQSLRTPPHGGVTDACLDDETLAAWVDGGLSGAALEMAEAHAADCVHCQSVIAATIRADAVVPRPQAGQTTRRWLGWLVPLTAAAAVAMLWIIVPREPGAFLPATTDVPRQSAAVPPTSQETQATGSLGSQPQAPVEEKEQSSALASAPAAAPPPATLESRRVLAAPSVNALAGTIAIGIEIVSPDPLIRWRIAGSVAEHSTNGGSSWDAVPTGVRAELTAGAAPTTSVCWLVGRGGLVLLTVDGRDWRRVAFPETTDLSAIQATDARTASVSAADGRVFVTSDGGATWGRR